jgi:hypothetical protein
MPDAFIFADEAGDFKFMNGVNISRYFILCTMRVVQCDIGAHLLDLRRSLLRRGEPVGDKFHASSDKQAIRDEVFRVIAQYPFRVDATVLEKCKAYPRARADEPTFYQYAWYYHAKFIVPHNINRDCDVLLTAAALETNKGKAAFKNAFNNVIQQTTRARPWRTSFALSVADPCLQAADYCAWAIQRRWEMNDSRSLELIGDRVASQFDLWRLGNLRHY